MKYNKEDYQNQLMLKELGYDIKVDGLNGAETKKATKQFQDKKGLVVDGIIGKKTSPILEKEFWKSYQTKLTYLGLYEGIIDGIQGRLTNQGTIDLQRENGLAVDKIVGVKTLAKLDELVANKKALLKSKGDKLSEHFSRKEFECNCVEKGLNYCDGHPVEISEVLIANLEILRKHFGKPITITSGARCQAYNDSLRGSIKHSKHVQGKAADIYIGGVTDSEAGRKKVVAYWLRLAGSNYSYQGTSNMGSAVHVDVK